jgi:hypothetical protein
MTLRPQSEISLQFKRCPMCGTSWASRDVFLADPDVGIVGYQVNFRDLEAGYFLFNHRCGDTMAIPVLAFRDLHHGPVFIERATGTVECPGHCLREDDLEPCPTHCECSFVRDTLQVVKNWAKTGGA